MDLNLSKCSATGKTRFATPGNAKQAMHKLKAKINSYDNVTKKRIKRRSGKPAQCRYYRCSHCKGYHLTSSDAALNHKTIEKRFSEKTKNGGEFILTKEQAKDWKVNSLPFPEQHNSNP